MFERRGLDPSTILKLWSWWIPKSRATKRQLYTDDDLIVTDATGILKLAWNPLELYLSFFEHLQEELTFDRVLPRQPALLLCYRFSPCFINFNLVFTGFQIYSTCSLSLE